MHPTIRKYDPTRDYKGVHELIRSEGDEWNEYLQPSYQQALENSIAYVALMGDELCGYSRSLSDAGMFVWVIDLLVAKQHRGLALGRKLMECLLVEFPDTDVYVMSDVDRYYEKLGYAKEGSIFKVQRANQSG